jgi:DNA-directed RNA polymerase specialized sigma24 family protein
VAKSKANTPAIEGPEEELVALAVLLLRREAASQSELAREMHAVGFGPTRIAALLGTTSNTVNQAIQKGKKKGGTKRNG